MAFSTKLFRIIISNNYYQSINHQNDFDIEPTETTSSWMEQRKVKILRHPDGIELIWLSQHYDNPLELLKIKAKDIILSFVMTLKNDQTLNISELEAGYPTGQVYYLHNRQANNIYLLHSKAFMDKSDLVQIQKIGHYPTKKGLAVFAIIDIDLTYWMDKLQKQKKIPSGTLTTYEIKIQNRSTFWRYYLVDTKKNLNGKLSILSQGDPSYFTPIKASTEFPNTYWAESTKPMELFDQYNHFFSLCRSDANDTKNETTLLERLPYPTYDSLRRDRINKKKLYSDIVVYV